MYDLVVRAGTVVDGTGAAPRTADVAVRGDRIVEVGRVSERGRQEIDADGAIVAPGFVDIHTHYDGQATWESRLQPSSWHGVTTVVAGNCGVGFAPVTPAHHDRLIDLMEGVEDIPGAALHVGLSWDWRTFSDFLDVLDRRPYDIDLATQVPHAALRVHVMGDRAMAYEPATPSDAEAMARLAAEAVVAGALGFSTSRTLNHKTLAGELTPSYDAGVDELVAIARAVGKTGRGVFQLVSDFDDVKAEIELMRAMVAASGRPLSCSVVQWSHDARLHREVLAGIEAANEDGLPILAQIAPRPIGMLFGLDNALHPFKPNPVFQRLAGLSVDEQVKRMNDPALRAEILAAQTAETESGRLGGSFIHRYEVMYELTDPPNYEPAASDTIAARAQRDGVSPEELAYDIVAGGGLLYLTLMNYAEQSLDPIHEMLVHPHTLPGLSDGGAHVGMIADGSFSTTLLQHWVRDREGTRLDLPFVVQRQARDTARAVGLLDRGVLTPGYRADLNVIDLPALRLHRPEIRHDLPAGGQRWVQRADGYRHTVVAGQETYRDGRSTDALPGRLIRGAQSAPVPTGG